MKIQTKKTHRIKFCEIPKKVPFQVENHSVGHLMPKASQPWEKNGMIWNPTFCNKKDYCIIMFKSTKLCGAHIF